MTQDFDNPFAPPEAELTPEPTPQQDIYVLAGRGSRLVAKVLDYVVLFVLAVLAALVLFAVAGRIPENGSPDMVDVQFKTTLLAVGAQVLLNAYFWERNGQSIGKLALGIKIVRTNGEKAGLARIIFARTLSITAISHVPCLGPITWLVDALLIFRNSYQCLHDNFADTVVVNAR